MTEDWRERKKAATKHAIQDHALRLFVEKGYDATTVEEIAAAAGVSHMTFFRYFPRKEEVVEYDEYDPLLEDLIAARPPDEAPLTALHNAIRTGLEAVLTTDREALRRPNPADTEQPGAAEPEPDRAGHHPRPVRQGPGPPCGAVRAGTRRYGAGLRRARRDRARPDGLGRRRRR